MTADIMSRFLHTYQLRVLRATEDESDVDRIRREADKGTPAETVIDLTEVTGVAQSIEDDGKLNPKQCVLHYGVDEMIIESPYEEVGPRWLQVRKKLLEI